MKKMFFFCNDILVALNGVLDLICKSDYHFKKDVADKDDEIECLKGTIYRLEDNQIKYKLIIQLFDERLKRILNGFSDYRDPQAKKICNVEDTINDINNTTQWSCLERGREEEIQMLKDFMIESYAKERSYFEEVIQNTPQIWGFVEKTLLNCPEAKNQFQKTEKSHIKFTEQLTIVTTALTNIYETMNDVKLLDRRKYELEFKKMKDEIDSMKDQIYTNPNLSQYLIKHNTEMDEMNLETEISPSPLGGRIFDTDNSPITNYDIIDNNYPITTNKFLEEVTELEEENLESVPQTKSVNNTEIKRQRHINEDLGDNLRIAEENNNNFVVEIENLKKVIFKMDKEAKERDTLLNNKEKTEIELVKRYEEATRVLKDIKDGKKDMDIHLINKNNELEKYREEIERVNQNVWETEDKHILERQNVELDLIKAKETILLLRSDIEAAKKKCEYWQDEREKELKVSARIKSELDMIKYENQSLDQICRQLKEELTEVENQAKEDENKYNANQEIIERRLTDALEERKRLNERQMDNTDIRGVKDRFERLNVQNNKYIEMLNEKDSRINHVGDENAKLLQNCLEIQEELIESTKENEDLKLKQKATETNRAKLLEQHKLLNEYNQKLIEKTSCKKENNNLLKVKSENNKLTTQKNQLMLDNQELQQKNVKLNKKLNGIEDHLKKISGGSTIKSDKESHKHFERTCCAGIKSQDSKNSGLDFLKKSITPRKQNQALDLKGKSRSINKRSISRTINIDTLSPLKKSSRKMKEDTLMRKSSQKIGSSGMKCFRNLKKKLMDLANQMDPDNMGCNVHDENCNLSHNFNNSMNTKTISSCSEANKSEIKFDNDNVSKFFLNKIEFGHKSIFWRQ